MDSKRRRTDEALYSPELSDLCQQICRYIQSTWRPSITPGYHVTNAAEAAYMEKFLMECNHIESVSFSCVNMIPCFWKYLMPFLENAALKEVRIWSIRPENLLMSLALNKRIERVSLQTLYWTSPSTLSKFFSQVQCAQLAVSINCERELLRFELAGSALRRNAFITEMEIEETPFEGHTLQSSTAVWKNLPLTLRKLSVSTTCSIVYRETPTSSSLLEAVRDRPSLKSLDLDVGFLSKIMEKEFVEFLRTTTTLEHLKLCTITIGCLRASCEALSANAFIKHIEFSVDLLDDDMGQVLGSFLQRDCYMTKFGLHLGRGSRGPVTEDGIRHLSGGLTANQNLNELTFNSRLWPGQFHSILEAVQSHGGLKRLVIHTDISFALLYQFLKANTTLSSLKMLCCIGENNLAGLLISLQMNEFLEELEVLVRPSFNFRLLSGALQGLKRLQVLVIEEDRSQSDIITVSDSDIAPILVENFSLFEVRGGLVERLPFARRRTIDSILCRNRHLANIQRGDSVAIVAWPTMLESAMRSGEAGPWCTFGYLRNNLQWIHELKKGNTVDHR